MTLTEILRTLVMGTQPGTVMHASRDYLSQLAWAQNEARRSAERAQIVGGPTPPWMQGMRR